MLHDEPWVVRWSVLMFNRALVSILPLVSASTALSCSLSCSCCCSSSESGSEMMLVFPSLVLYVLPVHPPIAGEPTGSFNQPPSSGDQLNVDGALLSCFYLEKLTRGEIMVCFCGASTGVGPWFWFI